MKLFKFSWVFFGGGRFIKYFRNNKQIFMKTSVLKTSNKTSFKLFMLK